MNKKLVKRIQTEFANCPDLTFKEIKISTFKSVYVFFLETISGSDKVNDYVLKQLSRFAVEPKNEIRDLNSMLPGPNTVEIDHPDKIEFYLTNGFTVIFSNFQRSILAIETKADLDRGVSTPDSQPALYGPKDAFTENYQKNLGLIKRRIKSSSFATDEIFMGRKTNTKIGIMYFKDIADEKMVNDVKTKLEQVDTDGILDAGYLSQFLVKEDKSPFPEVILSERPDHVVTSLMEGKVAIMMDTSPFVLILPAFLVDFINPVVDNYSKNINVNFLKILRFLCFLLTVLTPAFYIAITNYNQETIPTSLIINFSIQRDGVPFPAIVEAFIMLLICEILRESDIRFPSAYGSAVSILGALILGEAAVNAGIVSPIMIIVIAMTFITSLVFIEQELVNALRHFRFLFLVAAAVFGLYGIVLAGFYFLIHACSLETFGKPYMFPLAPFGKTYFHKSVWKNTRKKDYERSPMLTDKNIVKQRGVK